MKIKNSVLKDITINISESLSQSRKITLDKDGFVSEVLTEEQMNTLSTVPDFVLCDDEGTPIVKEKVLIVDEQKTPGEDVAKLLAANAEAEEKIKQLVLAKAELEETVANLTADNENLKAEKEVLEAQLNIKQTSDVEEGKKTEGEQLVLGQKKLEDGKAWIVKEDGKGGLVWRRDKENDSK